jgi:glycosyltransferase involved in cell wall biosynthesis
MGLSGRWQLCGVPGTLPRMTVTVSVIIPARDAEPTLGRTLEALRRQQLDEAFEVIVVDDGSQDETRAIAQRYEPFVRLICSQQSDGPGGARNRGAHAARAPVLAFTDADCFPTPKWLSRGLEQVARADVVQGRVEPDPTTPRTPFDRTLAVEGDGGFYQTANLFVRREVFDAVGGFRDWALERPSRRRWSVDRRRGRAMRTPIGEDTLFAWTARRLGARSAFAPEALVHHAVVPGGVRDAMADRWHWTRDMPGLTRVAPELRGAVFYHRWFFASWTAQFDLAVAGVATALLTRRRLWLLGALPYLGRVRREAAMYRDGRDSRSAGMRRGASYALGTPAVDVTTLAGFITGSIAWRRLVL